MAKKKEYIITKVYIYAPGEQRQDYSVGEVTGYGRVTEIEASENAIDWVKIRFLNGTHLVYCSMPYITFNSVK